MKKFVLVILVIIAFLTWNAAAYACDAFNAETIQHSSNYSSTSIIEWEETVEEEPTVEEPVKESPIVEEESTVTENPTVEEESTVEENPTVEEEPTITEEHTVESSSVKAEIKAKCEDKAEEVAPAGVTEKHFVQTGLLEDYRSLENKVIYLITALIIALLAYMPFNRKKAEARKERRNKNVKVK